jgi:hypothetical protein
MIHGTRTTKIKRSNLAPAAPPHLEPLDVLDKHVLGLVLQLREEVQDVQEAAGPGVTRPLLLACTVDNTRTCQAKGTRRWPNIPCHCLAVAWIDVGRLKLSYDSAYHKNFPIFVYLVYGKERKKSWIRQLQ